MLWKIYYTSDNFSGYTSIVAASPVSLPFSAGCAAVEPVPKQEYFQADFCNKFSITWRGLLQASHSGNHSFWLSSLLDDEGSIEVRRSNDNAVIYTYNAGLFPQTPPATVVNLQKGELYKIEVKLRNTGSNFCIDLQWKLPFSSTFKPVPLSNLYPEGMEYLAHNTVTPGNKTWCIRPDTIQAIAHHLIDSFNLIPGNKYVFSAWVKEDTLECKASNYSHNGVQLVYNGTISENEFKPAGNIIEGWQRYESVFQLPATATSIQIHLKNYFSKPVYFDDLRIHPFNSNIKTYVYHPQTLRLSAELDENNYASFYEYDDEGILTRVKKETKKGIVTIKETRSGLQQNLSDF